MLYEIMVHFAGMLMVFGLANYLYSLYKKKVTVTRRPLYILTLFMNSTLILIWADYIIERVWGVEGISGGLTRFGTIIVFMILGLKLGIVPFVDRFEFNQLGRLQKSLSDLHKALEEKVKTNEGS